MDQKVQAAQQQAICQALAKARKRARIRDIQRARASKLDSASLIAPFQEVLLDIKAIDDDTVDMLLTVDHDAQPDNMFSTPVRKLG